MDSFPCDWFTWLSGQHAGVIPGGWQLPLDRQYGNPYFKSRGFINSINKSLLKLYPVAFCYMRNHPQITGQNNVLLFLMILGVGRVAPLSGPL